MSNLKNNLPFDVEKFWYIHKNNSQLSVLAKSPNEKIHLCNPIDILLRWCNFQSQKAGHNLQITNFSGDFCDSLTLVSILSELEPKVDFESVFEEFNYLDRAKQFVKLVNQTSFKEKTIHPSQIAQGDQIEIVSFVSRLFLWKPNLEKKPNKSNQKHQNYQNKTLGYFDETEDVDELISRIRNTSTNKVKENRKSIRKSMYNKTVQYSKSSSDVFRTTQLYEEGKYLKSNSSFEDQKYLNPNTNLQTQTQKQKEFEKDQINNERMRREYYLKNSKIKKLKTVNKTQTLLEQLDEEINHQKKKNQNLRKDLTERVDLLKQMQLNLQQLNEKENQLSSQIKYREELKKKKPLGQYTIEMEKQPDPKNTSIISSYFNKEFEITDNFLEFDSRIDFLLNKFSIYLPNDSNTEAIIEEFKNHKNKNYYHQQSEFILLKALFDLFQSWSKFNETATLNIIKKIKKKIFSINPKSLKEIFFIKNAIIEILINENIINLDTGNENQGSNNQGSNNQGNNSQGNNNSGDEIEFKKSIEGLLNIYFFSKFVKFELSRYIYEEIVINAKILNSDQQKLGSNKENDPEVIEKIFEVCDEFICGIPEPEFLFKAISQYCNRVGVKNPGDKSKMIINKLMNNIFGKVIRFLCKNILNNEEKKQIEKNLGLVRQNELPLLNLCIQKSKLIMKNILKEDEIIYLTAVLTNDDGQYQKILNISEYLLLYFQIFGHSLQFVLMCLSLEVIKTMSGLSLLKQEDTIGQQILTEYTKIHGKVYLQKVLKNIIIEICQNNGNAIGRGHKHKSDHVNLKNQNEKLDNFEIDQKKILDSDQLKLNQKNVLYYFEKILKSIFNSIQMIPKSFFILGSHIKKEVLARFPDTIISVIGSFIFINFFCKAISNPNLYGIIDFKLTNQMKNRLNILSSAISSFSNGELYTKKKFSMMFLNNIITSKFKERSKFIKSISNDFNGIIYNNNNNNNNNNDDDDNDGRYDDIFLDININKGNENNKNTSSLGICVNNDLQLDSTLNITQYYTYLLLSFDKNDIPKESYFVKKLILKTFKSNPTKKIDFNSKIGKERIISQYENLLKIKKKMKVLLNRIGRIEKLCLITKEQNCMNNENKKRNKKKQLNRKKTENEHENEDENDDDLLKKNNQIIKNLQINNLKNWKKFLNFPILDQNWIYYGSSKSNKTIMVKKFFIIKNDLVAIFSYKPESLKEKPEELIKISQNLSVYIDNSLKKKNVAILENRITNIRHMFAFEKEKIKNWLKLITKIKLKIKN
ncbi:ras gtpase-activating protein [Anaeramoeba flamelloides]|uniref:Ras gtpase-activating protein n=1 Tax=Anaeramoeba flamelloides TaxID=1746091 RepID=A0AAV7YSJ6_9EUKA|nr:ras gtpase-activating protein [Anaeramoeba flamelloides]